MTTKSSHVVVLVALEAKEGKEDELHAFVSALIAPSKKEKGCLQYDFHRGIQNTRHFFVYEIWESSASLDAHIQTDHIQFARANIHHLLEKPFELTVWEKA